MKINPTIINEYQSNGVVVLRKIISNYWINKLQIGIKKNFDKPSKYKCVYEIIDNKEVFYDDYCNWQRINEYKEFFFNSGIAKIVAHASYATDPLYFISLNSLHNLSIRDNCILW